MMLGRYAIHQLSRPYFCLTWASALALLCVTGAASAQTPESDAAAMPLADITIEQDTLASDLALAPLTTGSYGSAVDQRWWATLDEEGLREGRNEGDIFISSGVAIVAMSKGVPGWIESRRMAFEIAFARAKAEMVRNIAQAVEETGDMRFIENVSFGQGYMEEVEKLGQAARIARKVGDFTEATLNMAISQLDPDYNVGRYSGDGVGAREIVLQDLYRQATVRHASRMIGGANTYQVFEGPTLDGHNHEILVGLLWTPNFARLAATIDDGRTAMSTGLPGQPVSAFLPQTVGEAAASFGTKVFIDENGDRAIIAFGQAEPANVDALDRDLARRAAITRAETSAASQIASFVRTNIALRDSVDSESISRAYADPIERGVSIDIEQVQSIQSATGTVALRGVETVWRQIVQHPETGQDIAVVAALWSPSGQAGATAMQRAIDTSTVPEPDAAAVLEAPAEAKAPIAADHEGMVLERPRTDRGAF
jgi:hypothetical protein